MPQWQRRLSKPLCGLTHTSKHLAFLPRSCKCGANQVKICKLVWDEVKLSVAFRAITPFRGPT